MTLPSELAVRATALAGPASVALRRSANWLQLLKFCVVGGTGYVLNLSVFAALLALTDIHFVPAAMCSFGIAVLNNYTWNRLWTFRETRGHLAFQGVRFLVVSLFALGANLLCLEVLVALGADHVPAQAIAIVLVTPVSFVGNKLWSFRA